MEAIMTVFGVIGLAVFFVVLLGICVYYVRAQVELMKATTEMTQKLNKAIDPMLKFYEKIIAEYED